MNSPNTVEIFLMAIFGPILATEIYLRYAQDPKSKGKEEKTDINGAPIDEWTSPGGQVKLILKMKYDFYFIYLYLK